MPNLFLRHQINFLVYTECRIPVLRLPGSIIPDPHPDDGQLNIPLTQLEFRFYMFFKFSFVSPREPAAFAVRLFGSKFVAASIRLECHS